MSGQGTASSQDKAAGLLQFMRHLAEAQTHRQPHACTQHSTQRQAYTFEAALLTYERGHKIHPRCLAGSLRSWWPMVVSCRSLAAATASLPSVSRRSA